MRVAARALIRERGKGKDSGFREGERKSAAETQLKYMERVVRRVQIGLACSADLRDVSALLRHSLRVLGCLAGREQGLLLGAHTGLVSWRRFG